MVETMQPEIKNYAVVNGDSLVVNVIAWDGVADYNPGAGPNLVQSDIAGIGWTYAGGVFTNPSAG